mmetsp:Transcript_8538/g.11894  ORF Transcript_8538/g.11894 Transcript_8538/m.11894 type:complete len:104 (-) Transcript_8538:71-382(-)
MMMVNALWELKGNVSVWAWASKDNVLVIRGVFQVVRHPLYGGLVLVCGSIAILQGNVDKIALTVVLAALLDKLVEMEEAQLCEMHKSYCSYAKNKKKMIPFIY